MGSVYIFELSVCSFTWRSRRRHKWWLLLGQRSASIPPSKLWPGLQGPSLSPQNTQSKIHTMSIQTHLNKDRDWNCQNNSGESSWVWKSIRVRLSWDECSWRLIQENVGECDEVVGSWGVWAAGASQLKDVYPRVRLLFPRWPQAPRFTRTLCSYLKWTDWCCSTDSVSWRCFMTHTNETVPSCEDYRGWWLHAVAEETAQFSWKRAALKLYCVFFPIQRRAAWTS